jgi:hypothetical protein
MDAPLLVLGEALPAAWPAPAPRPPVEAPVRPVAERYLARVAAEQHRFVDSLGAAQGLLDGSAGELAELAAGHTRLARQFLDGQRAILRHRADTDAAIAAIGASARTSGRLAPPAADTRVDTRPAPVLAASRVRPAPVAPLLDDAATATLAELIDGAFEDASAIAEGELRELLEGWWARGRENDQAALEDARAQAAAARHLSVRPPAPVAARPAPVEPDEPVALVDAVGVLDLVEHSDAGDLARLLDTLVELLGEPVADDDGRAKADVAPKPLVARGDSVASEAEAAFDRFWRSNSAGGSRGAVTERLLVQVLLPMVSMVAALALVLATIG